VARFDRAEPIAGRPVVVDAVTGLMWQGCVAGRIGADCETVDAVEGHDWRGALAYCQTLDWGGYADWYLPNAKELYGIVSHRRSQPTIDVTAFPAADQDWAWSSSSYLSGPHAWAVSFTAGYLRAFAKTTQYARSTRCVRRVR
jgi:hypothetical protein